MRLIRSLLVALIALPTLLIASPAHAGEEAWCYESGMGYPTNVYGTVRASASFTCSNGSWGGYYQYDEAIEGMYIKAELQRQNLDGSWTVRDTDTTSYVRTEARAAVKISATPAATCNEPLYQPTRKWRLVLVTATGRETDDEYHVIGPVIGAVATLYCA